MKIKGKVISGPNREIIAIPRGNGEDIIFVAEAVLDHKPFEKLCPFPTPRVKRIQGQDIPDFNDPNYQKNVTRYSEKKTAWLVITALKATEELEWDRVDENDPSTWLLFRAEMQECGFNDNEINRVINGALTAQGLNEQKVQEARDRFLRRERAQLNVLSSLQEGRSYMLSGEPANDSE